MKRTARYIPEIRGCYGPRLWVDQADRELVEFLTLISLWGGPVNYENLEDGKRNILFELPFGTFENTLWQMAVSRLDLCLVH